jgi:hypothetical protein
MRLGRSRMTIRMAGLLLGFILKPAFADDPANYLFATSEMRPEITIIDSSTDEVVGRVSLPGVPGDMTVLGRGRSLAIADRKAGRVDFVDVLGRRVERVVDVPLVPDVLRSDVTNTTLAALDLGTGAIALGSIEDTALQTVADIPAATYIVFDAKGRLLAAHQAGATIVDTTRRKVAELAVDPTNGTVMDVAADPGGDYAFVEQPLGGVLSVFDLHQAARLTVLHLPAPLGRIVPSQDSQFTLVPSGYKSISVVSTWTLKEKVRVGINVEPDSIGLALFQSVVTIISQSAQKVVLYDLRDEHQTAEIRLPGRPGLGAASPDGSKLYVTLPDTGQVASVNLTLRRIDRLIDDVGVGVSTIMPAAGNGYCH